MHDDEQEIQDDYFRSSHSCHPFGWDQEEEPSHDHAKQPPKFDPSLPCGTSHSNHQSRERQSDHGIDRIPVDRGAEHRCAAVDVLGTRVSEARMTLPTNAACTSHKKRKNVSTTQ